KRAAAGPVLFETCPQLFSERFALGAAGLNLLVIREDFPVVRRQQALRFQLVVLEDGIGLGELQAGGPQVGLRVAEGDGHGKAQAEIPIIEMVAGEVLQSIIRRSAVQASADAINVVIRKET